MADPIIPLGDHQPACYASHQGVWLMEPRRLDAAVEAYRLGRLPTIAGRTHDLEARRKRADDFDDLFDAFHADPDMPASRFGDLAMIRIAGSMMKGDSKFGGANTIRIRQSVRAAVASPKVSGIMIHIDESPGGHVSGTAELGDDVRRARAAKPLRIHGDDLIASAAYWVASQAPIGTLTMNAMGEAGSIGVLAVITDSSEAAEMKGFKVIKIATGERKGDGVPGTPIEPEAIAKWQADVDRIGDMFVATVADGRGMSLEEVKKAATGEVFGAQEARAMGLIDDIMSLDDAMGLLRADVDRRNADAGRDRRARTARARISIESAS